MISTAAAAAAAHTAKQIETNFILKLNGGNSLKVISVRQHPIEILCDAMK
jgi:hypothetical protein